MMNKNYVDDKETESLRRKDENEYSDSYEKRRTGYTDGEDPSMKDKEQQFPGDEIVEDLRDLSRQQGTNRDGDPTFLSGENVQQETDRQRYGDSISKNADKEFQQRDRDPSSESQNKSNNQGSY
jgi:hypothetical protein